jgi:hypothetical protein
MWLAAQCRRPAPGTVGDYVQVNFQLPSTGLLARALGDGDFQNSYSGASW